MAVTRRLLLASTAIAAAAFSLGWFPHGASVPTGITTFAPLKLGAGGQLTGLDIAFDGTKVVKTDAGNAYIWDATLSPARWRPLITSQTMPSGDVSTPTYNITNWLFGGVWEVRIAPSNTNRLYMINGRGFMFRSDDAGKTWIRTNFTQVTASSFNPNGSNKFTNQKIVIDPNNADVVYAGTAVAGVQYTLDAGVTWANVSAFSLPTAGLAAGLVIDRNSGTTTLSGVTVTKTIFLPYRGIGVYQSLDGGNSWTLIADGTGSSPLNVWSGQLDQ